MEYTFTLKYRLLPADHSVDDLIERLGAEGCDDALVGVGQPGRMALEFTREADSARDALQSALADVKRVMPEAQLLVRCSAGGRCEPAEPTQVDALACGKLSSACA